MEQFSTIFLSFIDTWGYVAVAVLMGLENACIPIPSELILGFAGYLIFAGKWNFSTYCCWYDWWYGRFYHHLLYRC